MKDVLDLPPLRLNSTLPALAAGHGVVPVDFDTTTPGSVTFWLELLAGYVPRSSAAARMRDRLRRVYDLDRFLDHELVMLRARPGCIVRAILRADLDDGTTAGCRAAVLVPWGEHPDDHLDALCARLTALPHVIELGATITTRRL